VVLLQEEVFARKEKNIFAGTFEIVHCKGKICGGQEADKCEKEGSRAILERSRVGSFSVAISIKRSLLQKKRPRRKGFKGERHSKEKGDCAQEGILKKKIPHRGARGVCEPKHPPQKTKPKKTKKKTNPPPKKSRTKKEGRGE